MNPIMRSMLGWMSGEGAKDAPDLALLHLLAKNSTFGDVVELGVGRGWSTAAMLSGVREAGHRLISYDIDIACRKTVQETPGNAPLDPHWSFRLLPGAQGADDFAPGTVALLFIDLTHSYEDLRDELAIWLPKIHPDGIICGQGFVVPEQDKEPEGVARAVKEFLKDHEHWYNLIVPRGGKGMFVMWPRMVLGHAFAEPVGAPW